MSYSVSLFLYNHRKQHAVTTAGHSKHIIEMFQNKNIITVDKITIRVNVDGFSDQCRCATALHLLSMLAQECNVIIYRGVGTPGHSRDDVDGLNATNKIFSSMLMMTVKIPGTAGYDKQTILHTLNLNKDISIAK